MDFLNFSSVEDLPGFNARAIFKVNSSSVFKEDVDIVPTIIDDKLSYIPWGGDNQMPLDILSLIEKDETLATCQCFIAEVCYGSGLRYDTRIASATVKNEVEDFLLDNDLASYFLGVSQDFKHFGFAVSVLILNEDGTKVVSLKRKEACYCRFTPADVSDTIAKIQQLLNGFKTADLAICTFEQEATDRNNILINSQEVDLSTGAVSNRTNNLFIKQSMAERVGTMRAQQVIDLNNTRNHIAEFV